MIFPVKYGTAVSIYTALFYLNTRNADDNPTLASGDAKISKDGGAFANLATLPDALPAAGRQVRIQLSAAETQCKIGFIEFIDQTATAEWDQQHIMFYTYGHPSAFDTSKFDCIRTSTAQAGAAGSITLDASASATNDLYIGCTLQIISGTGVGQSRTIILYVGSSKIAYVDRVWATNPDSTSVFAILPGKLTCDVVNAGVAQAGAANTITLASTAVATNNYYNTSIVTIISGTGLGQSRQIYSYVGSTRVATVKTAWAVNPDNTSVYFVRGFGNVDANLEYMKGSATPATNMAALANETYPGAVDTAAGAPTTTTFGTSTATLVKTDADYWKDRAILFTSGALEGQAKLINSCSKSTTYELFTTEAFTSAPGNGDTFEVI
jgi:hypothetical protein